VGLLAGRSADDWVMRSEPAGLVFGGNPLALSRGAAAPGAPRMWAVPVLGECCGTMGREVVYGGEASVPRSDLGLPDAYCWGRVLTLSALPFSCLF
jgi:hypothetical protein